MDEPIWMKLYTGVVYNLIMCSNEDIITDRNISRETIQGRCWPRIHKDFQNQDQDHVKNSFTVDFFLKPTIII